MNPVIAPISKNNNVEQQLDSREFPTIGKNATQFSNSLSRIQIEPQKIHVNTDLYNRESSISGIKETKFTHINNRNRINEIEREQQNQPISQTNEITNINKSLFYKKIKAPNFGEKSRLSEQFHKPDIDVMLYQLITKESKLQNAQKHNNSLSVGKIDRKVVDSVPCKTSDHKVDVQSATFEFDDIYWGFCPQNQNVSGTNDLSSISNNKSINEYGTIEVNFEPKKLFDTPKKEQKQYQTVRLDNLTELDGYGSKDIADDNAGARNIGDIKNPITNAIWGKIYKPLSFISLLETESHIKDEAHFELCIGSLSNNTNAENSNPRTKQIRLEVPRTYIVDKKQTFALEIKLGHCDRRVALRLFNRPERTMVSTANKNIFLSIVLGVPSNVRYIVLNIPESAQSEIEVQNVSLQVLRNTAREIMFDIPDDNLFQNKKIINKEGIVSLNNYENSKSGSMNNGIFPNEKVIDKGNPILTSKNEDLKFDISGNEEFSNKKIVNKEDFVLSNNNGNTKVDAENNVTFSNEKMADKENFVSKHNYKNLKLDISDSKPLLNENIANKENSTLQNNCEDQKFGTRDHEVFQNGKIINKGNFLSLNNYENPKLVTENDNTFSDKNMAKDFISLKNDKSLKLDIKNNEALSNEKKIDEDNFASLNNYENQKSDIKNNTIFSNEKIDNKEDFVLSNNNENTKFDAGSNMTFSNEKVINKEDHILQNNHKDPKFGIKNDMSFSNEEVVKKEDFIPSNNFKNTKLSVENYNGSFNEKVINEENLLSPNNCESPKFDIKIKNDEAFSNENIDNKKDFVLSKKYENSEFEIKNNLAFPNENIINKEDPLSLNNYENQKIDINTKSNEVFKKIDNKENFISQNTYENIKLRVNRKEEFSNEKIINKENFIPYNNYEGSKLRSNNNETLLVNKGNSISLDNYGNTKFDIRISGTFSNEKMINNEYSVPSNSNDENKKLDIKYRKVFLNEKIDNKEHSDTSNNGEVVENRDHESEHSVGILGRVAGFFGQIIGMCRRKK